MTTKQKPGALNYASAGIGSSLHMAAELLKRRAGIAMAHVAYKGAGPAVAALLASEVQVLTGDARRHRWSPPPNRISASKNR